MSNKGLLQIFEEIIELNKQNCYKKSREKGLTIISDHSGNFWLCNKLECVKVRGWTTLLEKLEGLEDGAI